MLAAWRQPEGLGSAVPWSGEQSTTAEGLWEEALVSRRSKVPLLGGGERRKDGTTIGIYFSPPHTGSQALGHCLLG